MCASPGHAILLHPSNGKVHLIFSETARLIISSLFTPQQPKTDFFEENEKRKANSNPMRSSLGVQQNHIAKQEINSDDFGISPSPLTKKNTTIRLDYRPKALLLLNPLGPVYKKRTVQKKRRSIASDTSKRLPHTAVVAA